MSELFDICGQLNHQYCLHLITLRFIAISGQYILYTPGILFQVHRMLIFSVDFQARIAKVPEYLFKFLKMVFKAALRDPDYLSKLVHTLRFPLAPTFFLGKCLGNLQYPLVIACRNIFPEER